MRKLIIITTLLFLAQVLLGCALGRKEWPTPQESEDRFSLKLMEGVRQDNCLLLKIAVNGAAHRLWRASIQFESVGTADGQGCDGCPFVPRDAVSFTRDNDGFVMQGNVLELSLCGLEPGIEYRFRVVGKSELPTMPLENTDVYTSYP